MITFPHSYPFDPAYGYELADLLTVAAPAAPADFCDYWQARYQRALAVDPAYTLARNGSQAGFRVYDIRYDSTGADIGGWLLVPEAGEVRQALVVGHGYGGRDQPDFDLGIAGAALLFPCFRGLSRSRAAGLPDQPDGHVVHGIADRDTYILGGCMEDLWLAVSVLLKLFPEADRAIGYMGISLGGGIGALALPWDARVGRCHFNVPTFGQQPLRLRLPTAGSGAAVQRYAAGQHNVTDTLSYYDAAIAAGFAGQAAHFAVACFDPVVATPGQFAIYNNWSGDRELFILEAGHFDYPTQALQRQQLLAELQLFFAATATDL